MEQSARITHNDKSWHAGVCKNLTYSPTAGCFSDFDLFNNAAYRPS
jgi:hypothetical protein